MCVCIGGNLGFSLTDISHFLLPNNDDWYYRSS